MQERDQVIFTLIFCQVMGTIFACMETEILGTQHDYVVSSIYTNNFFIVKIMKHEEKLFFFFNNTM